MATLRPKSLRLRAPPAHAVALVATLTLLPSCTRTPTCPPRDRAELVEAIDPSKPPRPAARALAEAWLADAHADPALAPRLSVAVTEQGGSFPFYELLLRVAPAYTEVADALAARGLPAALAAVPLGLSRYDGAAVRADCRAGYWLLPPTDPGVRVADCRLRGSPTPWSPSAQPDGELVEQGSCRIVDCATDGRRDLSTSTRAAVANLDARWRALPSDDKRLTTVVSEFSDEDPALVFARHLLATCFYADAAATWSARWKPAPPWCADALPYRAAEVKPAPASPTRRRPTDPETPGHHTGAALHDHSYAWPGQLRRAAATPRGADGRPRRRLRQ